MLPHLYLLVFVLIEFFYFKLDIYFYIIFEIEEILGLNRNLSEVLFTLIVQLLFESV